MRELGSFLAREAPEVAGVADIRRHHIEAYKTWLAERPRLGGGVLHRHTVRARLLTLRCFFERVAEWRYPDAPYRPLIFAGDLPIPDQPPPRFIDDAASAELLRTARADPGPFVRLVIELLARTGLRKGELMALTVDAVVRIGSAYWLKVPLGKLHNDRCIPLHPQLKELLDAWLADRPEGLRSELVFLDRGRPIPPPPGWTGRWPRPQPPPASATSRPTSYGTPWRHRPSTGACRLRPSPLSSGTAPWP